MIRLLTLFASMAVVVFLIAAAPSLAQSPATDAAPTTIGINYFDFFVVKGGPIAFALIVLSVITVALAFEHFVSIRRASMVPPETIEQTAALITEKKYLDAIQYTAEDPSMAGFVINASLVEASNGFEAMERAMEDGLDDRSAKLFRKIEYINIIGNVAPMIGLLGTVTGMIMLFAEIHAADAFPGARIVADRIAVALITTFWGLAVAIPALSIHAVLRNRIDVLTSECALAAEHILTVFNPASSATAGSGGRQPNPPTGPAGRPTTEANQ